MAYSSWLVESEGAVVVLSRSLVWCIVLFVGLAGACDDFSLYRCPLWVPSLCVIILLGVGPCPAETPIPLYGSL